MFDLSKFLHVAKVEKQGDTVTRALAAFVLASLVLRLGFLSLRGLSTQSSVSSMDYHMCS